jgi:hypothetical protein
MDWLSGPLYKGVVDALKKKGNQLHLYIKECDHEVVRQLVESGANLHRMKPTLRSEHRFSIRLDENLNHIIIRNKAEESTQITVEEYEEYSDHRALVNLALDMLDLIPLQS